MTQTRCALLLLLTMAGCGRKAPSGGDAAPPPPPPPVPADAAAAPVDAAVPDGPATGGVRVECPAGEKSATARLASPDSAELVVAHAGHFSQTYRFSFEGEQLRTATLDETSWAFSGGLPDQPETTDKVKRISYTFASAAKPTCETRTASGPTKEIEALLAKARATTGSCPKVSEVEALARHTRAGETGRAELAALVCR